MVLDDRMDMRSRLVSSEYLLSRLVRVAALLYDAYMVREFLREL